MRLLLQRGWLLLPLMAAGLLWAMIALAEPALAQAPTTPAAAGGGGKVDFASAANRCKNFPGLTNKVAACVRLTLEETSTTFFREFYPLVKQAIGGFVTLVIAVYGVLIAMGMLEKPSRDVMVLGLKLSVVTYFVVNIDQIYHWQMDMMDAGATAVVSFVPKNGKADNTTDYGQIECLQRLHEKAQANPQGGNPIIAPWLGVDCVLDSVIGLRKDDVNEVFSPGGGGTTWWNKRINGDGMSRGLMGFFFSTFQTSAMGMLMTVIGLMFIYGLIFLVIRALFIYLGGYLAISFLLILGPIFIPLMLFRATKDYFDKWVKLLINMTLQPILMLLFITMMIISLDLVIFSGNYSVMYKIAGEASTKEGFNLNRYLEEKQITKQTARQILNIKNDQKAETPKAPTPEESKNMAITVFDASEKCKRDSPDFNSEACKDYPVRIWMDSIDWAKLGRARGITGGEDKDVAKQVADEVFAALLFAGLVLYMMNALVKVVPTMTSDILGEFKLSPTLGTDSPLPGAAERENWAKEMSGRIGTLVSGRLGGKP